MLRLDVMESPIHILLTRPQEQSMMTAGLLRALGYEVHVHPLMHIEAVDGAQQRLSVIAQEMDVGAWVTTSKHGIEVLSRACEETGMQLPLYVPSLASADFAYAMGWVDVRAGEGDALSMLARLRQEMTVESAATLVYVRGQDVRHDVVTMLHADGYHALEVLAYDAQAYEHLPEALIRLWREDMLHVVMVYSPRSAQLLEQGLRDAGVLEHAATVHVVALSTAVAHALDRECWAGIHAASSPSNDAMLVTLKALYSEL
jgi:uroporphyrinogen-III synthase